jgi:hypothetical protein
MKLVALDENGAPLTKEERFEIYKKNNPEYAKYLEEQEKNRTYRDLVKSEQLMVILNDDTINNDRYNKRRRRLMKIKKLRDEGKTLEEIGAKIGITRERVRQISKFIIGWKNRIVRPPKPPKTHQCLRKGCTNRVLARAERKYCSRECWYIAANRKPLKDLTPEERRKYNNDRTKKYIQNHLRGTEKYRRRIKIYNRRAKVRHKIRMANDPIYAEKKREEWRKRFKVIYRLRKLTKKDSK